MHVPHPQAKNVREYDSQLKPGSTVPSRDHITITFFMHACIIPIEYMEWSLLHSSSALPHEPCSSWTASCIPATL